MSRPAPILGSMRPDGSRLVLHPNDVRGRWMTRRRLVFAVLILVYVLAPFIEVGGHPALHLDFAHRRFFLVGFTFNAQDFWMVVLLALAFAFGLLLVTAWRGRVWCGWACPQTVFLEGVYRPIERLIDGPRAARLKLEQAPWTAGKVARRVLKNGLFFIVSVGIAHVAAAIFVSPPELWLMIVEGPATHVEAFGLTLGFTAILTFNFAWFREQFCVVLCPYGRLQSVLHDRDSVTVAYDEPRGEPRGHLVKSPEAPPRGDCVDCNLCVLACPTGIDIRNGLQMECVACLQCVDACDEVMVKVGRPQGLIAFFSQRGEPAAKVKTLRPRLLAYVAVTTGLLALLGYFLFVRVPFESNVIRPRGGNPFVLDQGVVRNAFEVHLVNKHSERARFELTVTAPVAAVISVSTPVVELDSLTDAHVPVSVSIERAALPGAVELTLEIRDGLTGKTKRQPVRFLAPLPAK